MVPRPSVHDGDEKCHNAKQWGSRPPISLKYATILCMLAAFVYIFSIPLDQYDAVGIDQQKLSSLAPVPPSHKNLHSSFPTTCGQVPDNSTVLAITNIVDIAYNDPPKVAKHTIDYTQLSHSSKLSKLFQVQVCLYDDLVHWNELARELNITNWATHGGSAMGAKCYAALDPWDDDIDITIHDCSNLDALWERSESDISRHHPTLDQRSYSRKHRMGDWEPRLIKPDLLLLRGTGCCPWYKLLTVSEAYLWRSGDLIGGLDMECVSRSVTPPEVSPKRDSNWLNHMADNKPLLTVPFGPTTIQSVPPNILNAYISLRYGKGSPCQFPYTNGAELEYFETNNTLGAEDVGDTVSNVFEDDFSKSSLQFAVQHWYVPKSQRIEWKNLAGNKKQMEYTAQIPDLNMAEVDNSISPGCSWGSGLNSTLKVIGWNAERGKYWYKFYGMIQELEELQEPFVILMNEMDIGMARSGNVHTARRLALKLGMNYAYGVEFLELTRGTKEEQAATEGLRDVLSLHGNAILSKCIIGDALILRDPLPDAYFSDKAERGGINANGYEIRLGGRMGLFARIFQSHHSSIREQYSAAEGKFDYSYLEGLPPHFVVGNVHKVEQTDYNRGQLWNYYGFGPPPANGGEGVDKPMNQLGVVVQGDFKAEFCMQGGLALKNPRQHTFPVNCLPNKKVKIGTVVGDYFCSNMHMHRDVQVTSPCDWSDDDRPVTMSDHVILSTVLQGRPFY